MTSAALAQADPNSDPIIFEPGRVDTSGDTYGSPNLRPNELLPYGHLLEHSPQRERLRRAGVEIGLYYVGEAAANTTGERRDAAYAGQVSMTLDLDLQRIAGVPGLAFHAAGANRHGSNLSALALGDRLTLTTEIYGETFGADARLVYAYFEQKLAGGRVNLSAGRLPVGNDFATTVLACHAVSLTPACPLPAAISALSTFTAFPRAGWGARGRWRPGGGAYVQAGAYLHERVPAGGPSGLNFDRNIEGTLLPVELGWDTLAVIPNLPGHYKVGFAYDTSSYPDPLRQAQAPTAPNRVKGRRSAWVLFDQMLLSHGGRGQGLVLAGSYARSSPRTTILSQSAFLSLFDRGLIPGRPNDVVQVAAGWFGVSSRLRSAQQFAYAGPDSPLQRNEFVLEANYATSPLRGVTVQPAVQYFIHPNAERAKRDALVFALRITARL